MQNTFHVHHADDTGLLAQCLADGIAFVPFFPLGGGRDPIEAERLAHAARHRATVPQLALAWLLATAPATLAIPGTGDLDRLEENIAAAALKLTPDELAAL